jgi:spermidine synthase
MTDAGGMGGAREGAARLEAARFAPGLFAGVIFSSAALVFLVEPMIAKLVLPLLGGSPAVWNTSLAFFQAALLVGYAYAHLLQRIRSVRRQALIHIVVLLAAGAVLPLRVSRVLGDPQSLPPALWLTGVLALSIGAPFAALSATAPLLQAWYARLRAGRPDADNPYVLYAASNLGSLLALLAYPVLAEPLLRLRTQTLAWSLGYAIFVLLIATLARTVWRLGEDGRDARPSALTASPTTWTERFTWLALAAIPSSLTLGVTTYITTDIASAPFLWVVPLALYLLTFVIAFQSRPWIAPRRALAFQAAALLGCSIALSLPIPIFLLQIGLHLICFFLTALICHQALSARRPDSARLTEFYLLMSLGGVIGGAFNAFAAPLLFNTVFEYPLALMLACLARPWGGVRFSSRQQILLLVSLTAAGAALIANGPQGVSLIAKLLLAAAALAAMMLRNRAWAFLGLNLALAFAAQQLAPRPDIVKTERGFFGVLRVTQLNTPELGPSLLLAHGTTLHGAQAEASAFRCQPLVYYAPTAPIGQVFRAVQARKSAVSIGAVGMGAGTVATYTRPGDTLRFFEIDPQVIAMATDPRQLSYIKGCARGAIDWVLGDARLSLARQPIDAFDILLVDAFSSDSVPAHLLTVEAMRSYLAHIKPDGVVIMHLSNRNLELKRPVAAVAKAAGGVALEQFYHPPSGAPYLIDTAAEVVIVARTPAGAAPFQSDRRWSPARSDGVRVWTDDYTNLFGALVRRIQEPRQ